MGFRIILAVFAAISTGSLCAFAKKHADIQLRLAKIDSKLYNPFVAMFDEDPAFTKESFGKENPKAIKERKTFRLRVGRNRRSTSDDPTEAPASNFSFSDWGPWSNCTSSDCETEGEQLAQRTCYGTNLRTQQHSDCRYENLVRHRPCRPEHCNGAELTTYKWTEWTEWSKCSVSCGRGGSQQRVRSCTTEGNSTVAHGKCIGPQMKERECQYSSSCPTWDNWGEWSSCSSTCGGNGISYRKRRCIVYRYFIPGLTGDHESEVVNKEKNAGITIFQGMKPIHIIDAADGINMENATFFEGDTVKKEIQLELCLRPFSLSEEQKECTFQGDCKSQWTQWGPWSACRRGCTPGFKKRERTCIQNEKQDPCVGQKIGYRRCYPLPCWGPWVAEEVCSVTCGTGYQIRKRTCQLYSRIPPYDKCAGKAKGVTNCTLQACMNDAWTEWSPFSRCTVSCNGGLQFRSRTCLRKTCQGDSNGLKLCNRQRCPMWSKWGPYSCCNATCGVGMRNRNRTCIYGNIGELGCRGPIHQEHVCYRPPCDAMKNAIFDNIPCGTRPSSTLRIAQLRIFMGENSTPHGWPWQASWQHRLSGLTPWKHVCGASLIHSRWLVTAGHCIEEAPFYIDIEDPGSLWSVVLGMHELHGDGERHFTEKIFIHPKYAKDLVTLSDMALIKLREMADSTDHIIPICLPGSLEPEPSELCTVTGWGFKGSTGNHSKFLMEAEVPVVEFEKCRALGEHYKYHLSKIDHMCAGNPADITADSCTGDSGGPLSCSSGGDQWYLAAVTSFGFSECGIPGHAGIYTPAKNFEKWIREVVENNTYDDCKER